MAPPLNFAAIRTALVRSVRTATGLGQNNVVMSEPEEPVGQRPAPPFATIKVTSAAIKYGRDAMTYAGAPGNKEGVFRYSGIRGMVCGFDFYGRSHEEAYEYAATYQAGLDQDHVFGPLKASGVTVWRVDQVVDLSALLSTGYEGRAHFTVQFGLVAESLVDVGFIAHVPTKGAVRGAVGDAERIAFTADLSSEDTGP